MAKYKRLTQVEYDQIKGLVSYKLTPSQIHKVTGRSWNVIWLVKKTDSLDGYFEEVHQMTERRKANAEQARPPEPEKKVLSEPTPKTFDETNTIVAVLKAIEYNQQQMLALMKNCELQLSLAR
jgi:hypothetical protein